MKTGFIKTLLLVASLIVIASLDSSLYAQRQRRGVNKRYTSPEEIQRRQDSIKQSHSGDTLMFSAMPPITTETMESRPTNRPEQIDSVLALWRASSSKEYYDNYFASFNGYSDALTATGTYNNTDSLYIARLQGIMTPVPLTYNYEVRSAIERFCSPNYANTFSYAYYYFPIIEE